MKTIVAALVITALIVPTVRAAELDVAFEAFELDNGLTVILHQDNSTPLISTNIWYHVGSAYESPGRTGFAHLFEHIMFEGSQNVPEGMFDEWFGAVGGSPNGWTSNDQTAYVQTFSSSGLELGLFLESDRMGYLIGAMSEASVDGQRDVVKNERRQSYENRPYGLAWETLGESLYPEDHPYHWPVIGYMDDLSAAGFGNVVEFFTKYYSPNNASLVIAGDIDIAETRELVEKWFNEIPKGDPVERVAIPTPVLTEETLLVLEDDVQLPRIYMCWPSPPFYEPGDAAADITASILGGDKNSRLYKKLVYEKQIAQDVSVFVDSGLSSQFIIMVTARDGHTLDEIRTAVDGEIAKLQKKSPTKRELQRVLNADEVDFLETVERLDRRANQLNQYHYYVGDPGFFAKDMARYKSLSTRDVRDFAKSTLPTDKRIVLSIVPTGNQDLAVNGSTLVDKQKEGVE